MAVVEEIKQQSAIYMILQRCSFFDQKQVIQQDKTQHRFDIDSKFL